MIRNLKSIVIATILMMTTTTEMATGQTPAVDQPIADGIGQAQGAILVQLARDAMLEYLKYRTPADKQAASRQCYSTKVGKIDGKDIRLAEANNGVAVSLREEGKAPIRVIRSQGNLCGNIISASLEAMRSPRLPEFITPQILDSLTIEIEIIGHLTPTPEDSLKESIKQGFTGLQLIAGAKQESFILPSTCYQQDLDVSQMREICLRQLGYNEKLSPPGRTWRTFISRHFVGYPGTSGTVMLYRGKILPPTAGMGQKEFSASAVAIANYLINNQANSGMYQSGMMETSLAEHLYATYVMARLGKMTGDRQISGSAIIAIKFAKDALETREAKQTRRPQDMLACSALLAMSINSTDADEHQAAYGMKVLTGVRDLSIATAERLNNCDANEKASLYNSACLAMIALGSHVPPEVASAMAAIDPPTSESLTWAKLAGVKMSDQAAAAAEKLAPVQITANAPLDELGAFATPQEGPTVMLTSLMARLPGTDANAAAAAKKFCCMMMYRNAEAYFEKDPNSMTGGVRSAPSSAVITVKVCAAAIEALMETK